MIKSAKYVHTNLISRAWRRLAAFYQNVFGCVPVPPERDYANPELAAGTGMPGAALQGAHLRLPGFDNSDYAPTLEIFTYQQQMGRPSLVATPAGGTIPAVNRIGYGHIAFAVSSVDDARSEVLAAGGSAVGEVVTLTTATGANIHWCYVRDPEGNIIELQTVS